MYLYRNILFSQYEVMSEQPYRSEFGIISDILLVTLDCDRHGATIASIARKANMSHYAANEKCQNLVNFGLMKSVNNKKSHTFVITEKGTHFFQEIQKFIAIAQAVKLIH